MKLGKIVGSQREDLISGNEKRTYSSHSSAQNDVLEVGRRHSQAEAGARSFTEARKLSACDSGTDYNTNALYMSFNTLYIFV